MELGGNWGWVVMPQAAVALPGLAAPAKGEKCPVFPENGDPPGVGVKGYAPKGMPRPWGGSVCVVGSTVDARVVAFIEVWLARRVTRSQPLIRWYDS